MARLITLTTDFGTGSSYVAAMKGALWSVDPAARLVDLSHQIPSQDLHYTSYFLQAALPYFPPDTLHVIVVDPGVGSERAVLFVELPMGRLLVPDNGCWTGLVQDCTPCRVIQLTEKQFWRDEVSCTFHGRDIFAPVAGHLSLGVAPERLGMTVNEWQTLALPRATQSATRLDGEVVFIDAFGNLLTNIPGPWFRAWDDQPISVQIGEHDVRQRGRAYADADLGAPLVLVSSVDTVEVAVNQGNAARQLGIDVGAAVRVLVSQSD